MGISTGMTMRLVVLGWLAMAACGDDNAAPKDASGGDDDAAVDAALIDAYECPAVGTAPTCGATTPPTTAAPNGGVTCNPLTQTGCLANEKCAWIVDQQSPRIGHIGCAPNGVTQLGCACSVGAAGTTGYDDCVKGGTCISGTCKQICDPAGGTPACSAVTACTRYAATFESGGSIVAGACDPTCDPLTQCAATPTPIACGSTAAATPNKGCYGISQFSCAVVPSGALTLTDRMPAQTGGSGGTILNGCAPGFLPFLISMTGSTTAICSGVCAALETDNTPAHANNAKGDPKAFGKLPTMAGLSEGNATCEIGKKGSEATSACRFMWQYVVDDQGVLPASFTPFVDKLGICMGRTHYQYDSNGDGTVGGADATQPDCATLPPRSAATTGNYDDAADFGCQLLSHSMVAGALPLPDPDMRAVQATDAAVAVVRHDFR